MRRRSARPAEYISHPMLLIPAYAKLNLCLAVLGRRPDGFHDIDSVAVAIDWHDLVGLEVRAAEATTIEVRLTGAHAVDVPHGDDNLAARAAAALAALAGPTAVQLWLDKRLPAQAGLGGGSADAAAVLRGWPAAFGSAAGGADAREPLDDATRAAIAASLGSDVPVALAGGVQRMRGRGEQLLPVHGPELHLAVAIAGRSDTAVTFAATQRSDHEDGARIERVMAALEAGRRPDDDDLGSALEGPACRAQPVLGESLAALRRAMPGVRWHLTGSGGAVFSLAAGAAGAAELAAIARGVGVPARACRTVGSSAG